MLAIRAQNAVKLVSAKLGREVDFIDNCRVFGKNQKPGHDFGPARETNLTIDEIVRLHQLEEEDLQKEKGDRYLPPVSDEERAKILEEVRMRAEAKIMKQREEEVAAQAAAKPKRARNTRPKPLDLDDATQEWSRREAIKAESKEEAPKSQGSSKALLPLDLQTRRFRITSVSRRPKPEDEPVLAQLRDLVEKYWKHVESSTPFRPQVERCTKEDGRGWEDRYKYPDPMLQNSWIFVGARDHSELMLNPQASYFDRSKPFVGKLVALMKQLTFVTNKCESCGQFIDQHYLSKAHALLDQKYRLPGSDHRVRKPILQYKYNHDDCNIMFSKFVQVLHELKELIAEVKVLPEGPYRSEKRDALRLEFRERVVNIWRDAYGVAKPKDPELEIKTTQSRAKAIIENIEFKLEAGNG